MSPRTPFLRPRAYFEERPGPSLPLAMVLVALEAIVMGVIVYWFVHGAAVRAGLSTAQRSHMNEVLVPAVIGVLFGILLLWVIVSAVMYAVLWFTEAAAAGFRETLAIVGISHLVQLVLIPVVVLNLYLLLGDVPGEPKPAIEYLRRVRPTGVDLSTTVFLVGALWQAYIQAEGFVETHLLSRPWAYLLTLSVGLIGFLLDVL